jgi:hypothetical protein
LAAFFSPVSSTGFAIGASLRTGLSVETAVSVSSAGRNNMPAFGDAYSTDELYDVATFIVERLVVD